MPLPSMGPRIPPLSPPSWLHVTLTCIPFMATVPVSVRRLAPPTPKLALIECGPAAVSETLPMPWLWLDSALDSDWKPMKTVPEMLSTSPPLKDPFT